MPKHEGEGGKASPGIRDVTVGFGSAPGARPQAVAPPPPYRLLIAGDFALGRDGQRHVVGRRKIAELLEELSPSLEIVVENKLGTFPASVEASIRLDSVAALRPASLIARFEHHREAVQALKDGGTLAARGTAYDKLAALLAREDSAVAKRTEGEEPGGSAGVSGAPENGDDLDALFDLVDTPSKPSEGASRPPARRHLQDFIDRNIAPKTVRAAPASPAREAPAAAKLLDEQAFTLMSDKRLRQVLENWHALRLLQEATGNEPALEVTLVQIEADADAGSVEAVLSGDTGALHDDLFDLILLANRCAAQGAGAETLRTLADAASAFGIFAFATLTPDFAGVPADRLAALDAPHQLIDGAGFEMFATLRKSQAAECIAVFWNDVLAVEEAATSPALFIPAAWVPVAVAATDVRSCGWPRLRASAKSELSGFPVSSVTYRGRETAVATRTLTTADSAGGLASAGIAVISGRTNRDSVQLMHLPLLSESGSDALYGTKLGDQLVLARISMLMQAILPQVLREGTSAAEKAALIEERLAELSRAIVASPVFRVVAAVDEDDVPALDITAQIPRGVASRERFDFRIGL